MSANNTPSKHRRSKDHWLGVVDNVRSSLLASSLLAGKIHKVFEDDYFIFELIKCLYQDSVESNVKIEILTVIEQHGSGVLPTNSVDQSISALLDVFNYIHTKQDSMSVATQILITVATIFIENEELLETNLCSTFTSLLVELINKVNHIPSRRLRGCACQCLLQLETTRPGFLWKWREVFVKLAKAEKTDVCQDYMHLLIVVASNEDNMENLGAATIQAEQIDEGKELLPIVSHLMDNVFLLSPPGLITFAYHIVKLLKRCSSIPPTVFKPLVLQCLSSLDPCVTSLMLYIQNEFHGEIISEKEEQMLLKRTLEQLRNPKIDTNIRLFICQWIMAFLNQPHQRQTAQALKSSMMPDVFDPIDLHTSKLDAIVRCCGRGTDYAISSELYYLTQLAETTGGVRITCALYYILYMHVTQNSHETVDNFVLSITRKLFQNFPHLIPVIVDFLQAVKASHLHTNLHYEILTLLHATVLSLPLKSLLTNYTNYLQVWLLSAQDRSMLQQRPLRRLLELVQEAVMCVENTWSLGGMVLSVCRVMMLHHHTDIIYSQLGDLLFYMMSHYGDTDIQEQARCLYSLLTMVSDTKEKEIIGCAVTEVMHLGENIADFFRGSSVQTVPAEIHILESSPIKWHRVSLEVVYHNGKTNFYRSPSPYVLDALKDYYEQLSHVETSLKCTFSVSLLPGSEYDNTVAVEFQAEQCKELIFDGDTFLPFLDKRDPGQVVYLFVPKVPGQLRIDVRALFGHDKSTFQCDLDPISLNLADFLTPFPWQMFHVSNKQDFFDCLWRKCTSTTAVTSSGVESIKILKCSRQSLAELWSNALIASGNSEDDKGDTDDYLFFLPPGFHLMFHVRCHATNLVLHIASDYWPVLGQLNEYLDNLVDSTL